MRTIGIQALRDDPALYGEVADVLRDGGLVCFPSGRQYGVAASLLCEDAVIRLVQTKRRAKRAPALVFIPDRAALDQVVDEVPPGAASLIERFWPGPLTILFRPSEELPRKVVKTVAARSKDRVGVRITDEEVPARMVQAFDGPILVSSANLSKKAGSSSPAQVKKNFARTVDVFIEAGDMPAKEPSTVVDPEKASRPIVRAGAVSVDEVVDLLEASRA